MSTGVAVYRPSGLPDESGASGDGQLLELWLHGRSLHTQRAYRADIECFLTAIPTPWPHTPLPVGRQSAAPRPDLARASQSRTLSAVKSLLAFAPRTGYLPFDVGRALRLPAIPNRLAERILSEADLHRIL